MNNVVEELNGIFNREERVCHLTNDDSRMLTEFVDAHRNCAPFVDVISNIMTTHYMAPHFIENNNYDISAINKAPEALGIQPIFSDRLV